LQQLDPDQIGRRADGVAKPPMDAANAISNTSAPR
jgi:hypothetical protein